MDAEGIIKRLDLRPHPEGGYYRETYRSNVVIPGGLPDIPGKHFAGTAIYFLLTSGDISRFHRLKYDELFHFYAGDPVGWVLIHPDGRREEKRLGPVGTDGREPQVVIPAGCWFGGSLEPGGAYCLMGTTVAPGFEFDDFELADRAEMLSRYPGAKTDILRLTK